MRILAATIITGCLALAMCSCNQQGAGNETGDDLYMFTSFHEPADEGLRFSIARTAYIGTASPAHGLLRLSATASCVTLP